MSFFILGFIFFVELNTVVLFFSKLLVLISLLFFLSMNFFSLYIFFELSLFPILFLILGFGSQIEKILSSYYLLFYASFCSFPFLYIFFFFNEFFFFNFLSFKLRFFFFLIFCLCFLIKFPIYFFHLWLPKAHVEAPTTASILLAGLLLKLGTGGFLRIIITMFFLVDLFFFFSFLGILFCSFICLFQSDSKALAAYSSIVHISFLFLGLLFFFISSKLGRIILILGHGYTSTLIFFIIGEFFHFTNSRMIYFFNRFLNSNLFFVVFFFFVFLSNIGIPPSVSFFSELFIVVCSFYFSFYFLFLVFFYFVISFYYSLYFLVCFSVGKMNFFFSFRSINYLFFLVLMIFNFFWINLFYWKAYFIC